MTHRYRYHLLPPRIGSTQLSEAIRPIHHLLRQADAFNATTKSMVDNLLDGFNAALFAYGQSGGGKTYSLLGRVR